MNPDVLIIGGGVIGLGIARELHRAGAGRITVLERGRIGREASYAAAGMLAPNAEAEEIDDFYRLCVESNGMYPEFAEALLEETGIDIELDRSGTLYAAFSEEDSEELHLRMRRRRKAGIDVNLLSAKETREAEPFISGSVRESLLFAGDHQVENRKLLAALRKYAELNGIELREFAEVDSVLTESGKAVGVSVGGAAFHAGITLIATGAWTSFIKAGNVPVPIDVKPIRGQMLCYRLDERPLRRVIYSPRGYLVPRADGRVLAGATVEDVGFDAVVTDAGQMALEKSAVEIASGLARAEIVERWAGLRPYAADGMPVIGPVPGVEGLFAATGHYRNGILLTPITGRIMADRITGRKDSDFLRAFGPQRFAGAARI
jgi:glycine oxidase